MLLKSRVCKEVSEVNRLDRQFWNHYIVTFEVKANVHGPKAICQFILGSVGLRG